MGLFPYLWIFHQTFVSSRLACALLSTGFDPNELGLSIKIFHGAYTVSRFSVFFLSVIETVKE
jgi:hypothetical protein